MGGQARMNTEVLNISPLIVWTVALSQLLTFGLTLWNLVASGSRANTKAIEVNKARLDSHELRLASIENTLGGVPGREDMHNLQIALTEMKGEIREMRATMKGNNEIMRRVETIVGRHEDHLLDGAKR